MSSSLGETEHFWNLISSLAEHKTEPFRTWAIINKKSVVVLHHIVTDNLADYELKYCKDMSTKITQ